MWGSLANVFGKQSCMPYAQFEVGCVVAVVDDDGGSVDIPSLQ